MGRTKEIMNAENAPSIDISTADRGVLENSVRQVKVIQKFKTPFRVLDKNAKARSAFSISASEWKNAEKLAQNPELRVQQQGKTTISEEGLKRVMMEMLIARYIQGCFNISVDHNDPESIVPFLISSMKNIKHIRAHFLAHRKRTDWRKRHYEGDLEDPVSSSKTYIDEFNKQMMIHCSRASEEYDGETFDSESNSESISESNCDAVSVAEFVAESIPESVPEYAPESVAESDTESVAGSDTESVAASVTESVRREGEEAYEKLKLLLLNTYKEEVNNLSEDYKCPTFVNWMWVYENIAYRNENTLGDTSNWVQFIKHIQIDKDQLETETLGNECFRIHNDILRSVGFIKHYEIDICSSAKLFLLMNVMGLTSFVAMERFLIDMFEGNMRNRSLQFISKSVDHKFNTEDYDEIISSIVSCCHLTQEFMHNINIYMTMKENSKIELRQKIMKLHKGRPRLKNLVHRQTDDKIRTMYNMNSFDSWLNYVRFPNTISKRTRFMTYMIMSMPTLNHKEYIEKILNSDMAHNILKTPIANPDLLVIQKIIDMVSYKKQAFEELAMFRMECLGSLSVNAMRQCTLTKLFQLYLCAYQCKHIWKECWRNVLPILSFPMIQNIEMFVLNHPINGHEVYTALYYN